jgi:hypothetical protein
MQRSHQDISLSSLHGLWRSALQKPPSCFMSADPKFLNGQGSFEKLNPCHQSVCDACGRAREKEHTVITSIKRHFSIQCWGSLNRCARVSALSSPKTKLWHTSESLSPRTANVGLIFLWPVLKMVCEIVMISLDKSEELD